MNTYSECVFVASVIQHAMRMRRIILPYVASGCRRQLKCDGTRAETRFRLSAKRTSPFKLVGPSVQSTTVSRGVRISGSNAGYTMFRGSVKGIGYPLHSPVSPSLPIPCVTVCHHISTGIYHISPHYLINGTIFGGKKKLLNTKCVFWFSVQLLSETFVILRRIQRDVIKNVYWSPYIAQLILVKF